MSETLVGVIGIGGEDYLRKPNSVGVPLPVIDVKYIDDDGKEVPVGQVGELCVRGPQILKEYFEKKEATEKTFAPGGWLKTGDLGKCDEEGFHYIGWFRSFAARWGSSDEVMIKLN